MSLLKSRKQLTLTAPPGPQEWQCALCHGLGYRLTDIKHAGDCLLKDPAVTHVRMITCCRRVVIHGPRWHDGKFWWTSPSGVTYDIERSGYRYYVMSERSSGKVIEDSSRLRDIRQYIVDNQGRL